MKEKIPKCPHCFEEMIFDPTVGTIVGGFRVPIADKETGRVHLSQGAHPSGRWICMNCDGVGNTMKDILKDIKKSLKDIKKREVYCIYEYTPSEQGDVKRLVEIFDTKEDAEIVLKALESVNKVFNCYKIEKVDGK